MAKNKIGRRQRESRKAKADRLIGRKVTASFIFPNSLKQEVCTISDYFSRDTQGYLLKNSGIRIPLAYFHPDGYQPEFNVILPDDNTIVQQLKNFNDIKNLEDLE